MGDDRKKESVSRAARALSALGSSKGGKARAEKLSAGERHKIASQAAKARWGAMPLATHGDPDHPLRIGDVEIQCYVLENGTRILSQRALQTSIGINVSGGAQRLHGMLSKFADKGIGVKDLESRIANPLLFRMPGGGKAHGFEATVLADFCEVVLAARDKGLLAPNQLHIARQCEILIRGFARVGIIALIDEATGYQKDRSRRALEEILDLFIKDELGKWMKTFPDDFYSELFRLKGLQYIPFPAKRPRYVGIWTNDVVYHRLAPGILDELKRLTPKDTKGRHQNKLHQRLTEDVGHPRLREHLASVVTLMKASDDWSTFKKMLDRSLPKFNVQSEDDPDEPESDCAEK
jgi:hypothetical protein